MFVNGGTFLNLFLANVLLVYTEVTQFCMLIGCPETWKGLSDLKIFYGIYGVF